MPLVPNVYLQYTSLEQDGDGSVGATLFNEVTVNGEVANSFDLSHFDARAAWELIDTVVHIDFGLQVKQIDGSATIEERGGERELHGRQAPATVGGTAFPRRSASVLVLVRHGVSRILQITR